MAAILGLIILLVWTMGPLPDALGKVISLIATFAVFASWIVGFFFSVGSLLCRERRPLFSALLVLFYVATASLAIFAPFRSRATEVGRTGTHLAH